VIRGSIVIDGGVAHGVSGRESGSLEPEMPPPSPCIIRIGSNGTVPILLWSWLR